MGKKISKKGKKNYEKYRAQNRKARNKELKAARLEKKLAKFAARREAGLTYEYKAITAPKGSEEYIIELLEREEKSKSKKLPLQRLTSAFKKLQNELDAIEKNQKLAKKNGDKKKAKKKK